MKIVAQIVQDAKVVVNEEIVSTLNYGLLLLVSFTTTDTKQDVIELVDKVVKMRIFPDEDGKTNLTISDAGGAILSISQFTLYGAFKGRRPSFTDVMPGSQSKQLYDLFNKLLRQEITVKEGVFGAHMDVSFTNIGPVTYILESANG